MGRNNPEHLLRLLLRAKAAEAILDECKLTHDGARHLSAVNQQVCVLATLCAVATLHPRFRHPTLRPYRSVMYAGLGLSAVVFVVHGVLLHGWEVQNRRMSIDWMILMALFNLVGAVTYAVRVRVHS